MFTPVKRAPYNVVNEMGAEFQTPRPSPLAFSKELRQVLQERNLLTAKSRKKVCALLNGSSCSSAMGSPNPEVDKRKSFRLQAIQEIISSEHTYLSQLEMLMQFFVRPLKEQAIIDETSHTALFGQVEMIYNLNGELLRELEINMENVAHAFLKMAPFFKLYSVYAFDYRNALLILQDLTSKNPVFRKFLDKTESRPEVQRKLNSLLIVPIQRVPRYKLLLEQVLLYTSPAESDFKSLKESVKQIESIVSHINACIEDQEVTLMLINLQNSLVNRTPNIVKPSRKVIKEGVLQKITRNGSEIRRYCVLMSDIFMYCKVLKERPANTVVENALECCCIFPLKKCKVHELFPGNFKVTCQGDGIILGTTDMQLGRAWVGFIRDAIDLHIQCRKTLRKESSKRKPIRRKDIKKFDTDFVLSPNKKKSDYDRVFRNKNRSTDSEDEAEDDVVGGGCFPRKKNSNAKLRQVAQNAAAVAPQQLRPLKRCAPPPPPPPPSLPLPAEAILRVKENAMEDASTETSKRISKLYKLIVKNKTSTRGILKNSHAATTTTTQPLLPAEHDPSYGFAVGRYSDTKSYFRTPNVDNTIPTAVQRSDLFDAPLGDGNFRDVLYPLRLSGGSNKSGTATWSLPTSAQRLEKENSAGAGCYASPPQKKRVKFDFAQQMPVEETQQPFPFYEAAATPSKLSLRERIYDFFVNLF